MSASLSIVQSLVCGIAIQLVGAVQEGTNTHHIGSWSSETRCSGDHATFTADGIETFSKAHGGVIYAGRYSIDANGVYRGRGIETRHSGGVEEYNEVIARGVVTPIPESGGIEIRYTSYCWIPSNGALPTRASDSTLSFWLERYVPCAEPRPIDYEALLAKLVRESPAIAADPIDDLPKTFVGAWLVVDGREAGTIMRFDADGGYDMIARTPVVDNQGDASMTGERTSLRERARADRGALRWRVDSEQSPRHLDVVATLADKPATVMKGIVRFLSEDLMQVRMGRAGNERPVSFMDSDPTGEFLVMLKRQED